MSAHRSPRLVTRLRVLLALAAVALLVATLVGANLGGEPAHAKAAPTTAARRSTATTRRVGTTTTRPATTTAAVTTVAAGADDQLAAASDGSPALLVSGPEVAAISSRRDLLLSPGALWAATATFALVALVIGGLTARYWRRTSPG